jgi:tetratricopeptide (TPR) repeat protein
MPVSPPVLRRSCVPPNAGELLDPCVAADDEGRRQPGGGKPACSGAVQEVPSPLDVPADPEPTAPPGPRAVRRPDYPWRRDTQPRAEGEIRGEIDTTRRLLRTTPETTYAKADLYLRMGQICLEMSDARLSAARALDARTSQAEGVADVHPTEESYRERGEILREADEWSDEAIEAYYVIATDFPDWPRVDEAIAHLAFIFDERARRSDSVQGREDFGFKARSVYNVLIRDHAESRHLASAYLSFAEFYLDDPERAFDALRYYERALAVPRSEVRGYALYKKAWALQYLAEYGRSLDALLDAIAHAERNPQEPGANELLDAARADLPLAYARSGRVPEQAWPCFESAGGAAAGGMMERVAGLYDTQGDREAVIVVCRQLLDANPGLCTWSMGHLLIETALRWLRAALHTEDERGTIDSPAVAQAGLLLDLFLARFGDSDLRCTFDCLSPPPGAESGESHGVYEARYWRAEAHRMLGEWKECAAAHDEVARADPSGPHALESARAAVACHKQVRGVKHPAVLPVAGGGSTGRARGPLIPPERGFTPAEQAMEAALRRFLCYGGGSEERAEAEFSRASLFVDAGRWQEAAVLLDRVTEDHQRAESPAERRIAILSVINRFEILTRLEQGGVAECAPEIDTVARAALEQGYGSGADADALETQEERERLALFMGAARARAGGSARGP